MSRTVSARIPKEMHEKLRDKCNDLGCSINDYIVGSIEIMLDGSSGFDFGDQEKPEEFEQESKAEKVQDPHEGKKPCLHFHWEGDKLVQGETTWE